jgi:hypothetical protein
VLCFNSTTILDPFRVSLFEVQEEVLAPAAASQYSRLVLLSLPLLPTPTYPPYLHRLHLCGVRPSSCHPNTLSPATSPPGLPPRTPTPTPIPALNGPWSCPPLVARRPTLPREVPIPLRPSERGTSPLVPARATLLLASRRRIPLRLLSSKARQRAGKTG